MGFGFLDNVIMIVAGEYIDHTLGKSKKPRLLQFSSTGVALSISTMAAAALGNLISDVAGVGLAHYVETLVSKVFGKRVFSYVESHFDQESQHLHSPPSNWSCAACV